MDARERQGGFAAALACALGVLALLPAAAGANAVPQVLPLSQDWNDTGLITKNGDMSAVPGINVHSGSAELAQDPQTVLTDFAGGFVFMGANKTNPNNEISGGGGEFHLPDPVVALQSDNNRQAPNMVLALDTTNSWKNVVSYTLRDIETNPQANAIQQFTLQYRVGGQGDYTNIPAAFRKDVTDPFDDETRTSISVELPADANNQPLVNVRVITTNAIGQNDEWVGVDDISVTGTRTDTNADAVPDAPLDTDADGFADSADGCPALAGAEADGCPPLELSTTVERRQDPRELAVEVACSRSCSLIAQASGKVRRKGFRSKPALQTLADGAADTLELRFAKKALKRLKGREPKATIAVQGDPVAGAQEPSRATARVTLAR